MQPSTRFDPSLPAYPGRQRPQGMGSTDPSTQKSDRCLDLLVAEILAIAKPKSAQP
jgi:hypothetical protein